uniref:Uncharacterized protein n=1 Tax=viral metagenome TaxID=1070528 RepID=A0A6C0BSR9_9ZZZZ
MSDLNGEDDVYKQIEVLREMKASGVVMETNEDALKKIEKLQKSLQVFIPNKYGPPPYKVELCIEFPLSMLEDNNEFPYSTLTIQLAPIEKVPYTVFYFLEYMLPSFIGGNFKRNAPHVLQAKLEMNKNIKPFAFQEYNRDYTHTEFTIGFAGRPSNAEHIYISTRDNTRNHGPGSQGSKTEADCILGKLIGKYDIDVVKRMRTQPGNSPKNGFVHDSSNFIFIERMRLISE